MTIERYLDQLHGIREKFQEYQWDPDKIIRMVSFAIHHTVISKGELANPTPYYSERLGSKLKGKVLREAVASNDCMRYHYDADDRIIMVEEYSVSQVRFRIRDLYIYGEQTERLHFSSEIPVRLFVFDHEFSDTSLCLSFAGRNGYCVEEYVYEEDLLRQIRITRDTGDPQNRTELHDFIYEGRELIQIERICQNGYRELLYTTKKPNFSEIREEISAKLRKLIFEHKDSFVSFGIEGFLDQSRPMFCVCFTEDPEPCALIADWNVKMHDIWVYDWRLNDAQEKKCAKLIAEIIAELAEEGMLKDKQVFFHQNQVCAAQRYAAVKSVFRKSGMIVQ